MTSDTLPGRHIEDVPYTGLLERLNRIAAVAHVVSEAPDDFDREDLLNMIVQLGEVATEAVVFAGATQSEAVESFKGVMAGLSFGRADQ